MPTRTYPIGRDMRKVTRSHINARTPRYRMEATMDTARSAELQTPTGITLIPIT